MFIAENSDLSKDLYLLASPFYNFPNMTNKPPFQNVRNERVSPKLQLEFLNEFMNANRNDYFR